MNNIRQIKRRNAKLYPIYKMFAWDLLFFYSIEFLLIFTWQFTRIKYMSKNAMKSLRK